MPAWPEEAPSRIDVDLVLQLSGLVWLAVGLGGRLAAFVIVSQPQIQTVPDAPPPHIALIGLPVALVGAAHLIVYGLRRRPSR